MPIAHRFVAALGAAALLSTAHPPASAQPPPHVRDVRYEPPVDAPVAEAFRAPRSRYAAGNRGIDYATEPGTPVRAAADGVVTFAGRVGRDLHVVVAHADGVRTTYGFVAAVAVHRGERVALGDVVATAGATLHLGARIGDAYVDPAVLLAGGAPQHSIRLVDDEVPTPTAPGPRARTATPRRPAPTGPPVTAEPIPAGRPSPARR